MADFSAGAVMAMLGVVEATVITLWLRIDATKADEEDVDDVEETAEDALEKARAVKRDVGRVERRVEDAIADGGERDP